MLLLFFRFHILPKHLCRLWPLHWRYWWSYRQYIWTFFVLSPNQRHLWLPRTEERFIWTFRKGNCQVHFVLLSSLMGKDELISKMSYKMHKLGQRSITQSASGYDWDYVDDIKENSRFLNTHTKYTFNISITKKRKSFASRHRHAIHCWTEIRTAKQNCTDNWSLVSCTKKRFLKSPFSGFAYILHISMTFSHD